MNRYRALATFLCASGLWAAVTIPSCFAQTVSPATLNIVVVAAAPKPHSSPMPLAHSPMLAGRIVQVNGQRASGTWTSATSAAIAGPLVVLAGGAETIWTFYHRRS